MFQIRIRQFFKFFILLILLHTLVMGCDLIFSPSIPRTETIPGVPGAPFPYVTPEEVGLSSSTMKEIADQIKDWVRDDRIVGGEIMILKDKKIVLHEAIGWSDREREIALARNSIYRIRSMTKPFIGTSTLILVEEGALNLDDSVANYLPSFDNDKSKAITILHCLTHSAGYIQDLYPEGYWFQPSLREAVDLVGEWGPPHPPGQQYRYADLNSAVLGAIVAELTESPVEHFLQNRIFEILGLFDTYSYFTPAFSWASRMNSTYRREGSSWVKYWHNKMPQEAPFFRASGGLYSTVFDYAKFLLVWMERGEYSGGQLLSEETIVEALSGSLLNRHYGYHWELYADPEDSDELPVFGHAGSDGTIAIAIPENNIIVLYFTQSRGNTTIEPFIDIILGFLR